MTEEEKMLLLKYDTKYGTTDSERLEKYILKNTKIREYHRNMSRNKAQIKLNKQIEELKDKFNSLKTEEDEQKKAEIFKQLISNTKRNLLEKII
jgi:uncharacterized protein YlxW (UPF0749 family)